MRTIILVRSRHDAAKLRQIFSSVKYRQESASSRIRIFGSRKIAPRWPFVASDGESNAALATIYQPLRSNERPSRVAILREPKILILDDALSSVDTYTEEKILAQLRGIHA